MGMKEYSTIPRISLDSDRAKEKIIIWKDIFFLFLAMNQKLNQEANVFKNIQGR